MDVLPQTMLFLGVIPALVLLYFSLKKYDGMYKEKTMFIMFIGGIVTGVLSIIMEYSTLQVGFLAIVLFPILEQMFKTVILNMRRYQNKKEAVLYGLSLGLGFGSVFTPYYIIVTSLYYDDINILYLALVASIGIIILHGATGVLIGYGVYTSKLVKYFLIATLLYLPVPLTSSIKYSSIALIPYGLVVYWYSTMKIMPKILEKRKKVKK